MYEFNVTGQCDICKEDKICTEVILIKDKKQEVRLWCEKCFNNINEEVAQQQEEDMQETYESLKWDMR